MLSSAALVFDTTSPSAEPANTMLAHRAISLNHGWLHRVMGISPPAGSLSAALLACVWDWTEVSLSLMESLRYSLPQAVFWTDGPAWHLIWPSLIGAFAVELSNSFSVNIFFESIRSTYRWSWRILRGRFPFWGPSANVFRSSDIQFSKSSERE